MRKLLLLFSLLVILCQPAAANPVTLTGFGDVDLEQAITVTEAHDKNGSIIYNLKVKDGNIWRGAMLFPPKTVTNKAAISTAIKTDVLLDNLVAEKFAKRTDFIEADKAAPLQLGSKIGASTNLKATASSLILNMNIILLSTNDGNKFTMLACADSDMSYWQPIFHKIVSTIQ